MRTVTNSFTLRARNNLCELIGNVSTEAKLYFCFVGAVGTFSIFNDRRLPSSAGPTHPQPDGHYLLNFWGPASPGPPTIRCWGFMLLREAELTGTGVPGGTTETYVSHIFNVLGLVVRRIEPAIIGWERGCLPKVPRGISQTRL